MATPDFVLELRRHVGHAPLWMPGATAVVLRRAEGSPAPGWSSARLDPREVEVLCVRRADNGAWTPVTGIVDPGEEPAVVARPTRLLSVEVVGPVTYGNGDVTTYLDVAFACEWAQGRPEPADGENTEARFVRADRLPPMNARFTRTIARALSGEPSAVFLTEPV